VKRHVLLTEFDLDEVVTVQRDGGEKGSAHAHPYNAKLRSRKQGDAKTVQAAQAECLANRWRFTGSLESPRIVSFDGYLL